MDHLCHSAVQGAQTDLMLCLSIGIPFVIQSEFRSIGESTVARKETESAVVIAHLDEGLVEGDRADFDARRSQRRPVNLRHLSHDNLLCRV